MIARVLALAVTLLLSLVAPTFAQRAGTPLDSPAPLRPDDAFGEEITLGPRTVIYFRGHGTWDTAFETLLEAFGSLKDYVDRQSIKPSGNPLTIYTQTDDSGFRFLAALPIAEAPKDPPKGDIAVGTTPTGRALKFTHRGSYESMDTTYEAITNYLDDRQLEAQDTFVEEYVSGPLQAGNNDMVIEVYVPLK